MKQVTENQFVVLFKEGRFSLEFDTRKKDFCIFKGITCISILYKVDGDGWIISELEQKHKVPTALELHRRLRLIYLSLVD